jgi:hypothetical protein
MKIDSPLLFWWNEFAVDLYSERRNALEKINDIISKNGIVTEIVDKNGNVKTINVSAKEYYNVIIDKEGKIIDSDRHKEIRAEYASKILHRYVNVFMVSFGNLLGIVGGILGIIAFFKMK